MTTIYHAERELYLILLALSQKKPEVGAWLAKLPDWLAFIKDKNRYAQAPYYASVVDKLPNLSGKNITPKLNCANITAMIDLSESEFKKTHALLKNLMPWRKGGFVIGRGERQIHIDAEWRSDLKWDRLAPFLGDLTDKRVLDVGGGSGYHGFRMAGAGASTVMVIDPSCLFYHQFITIRHFLADSVQNRFGQFPVHFLPVGLEELPKSELFHMVFCMGVLYHRASPFECLAQLKAQLAKGGTLVLETLVVEGDEQTVLVPQERYAQMNNVYFLPSVKALTLWLDKAGFSDITCVDVNITTSKEQRATEWMTYHSLADFLHLEDSSKTIEGYPRPKRAIFMAKK